MRWTFADLRAQSQGIAGALAARGVRQGDRVAIAMENRPEYLATLFGCAQLGAILATVNPDFRADEIQAILRNAEPACIVADRAGAVALQTAWANASIHRVPVLEIEEDGALVLGESYVQATASAGEGPSATIHPDDAILILYTSGSTAEPKGVVSTHRAEVWSAEAHRRIWHIGTGDGSLVTLPLAWAYGLATVTLSCLSAGAKVVLLPRFKPDTTLRALVDEPISHFFGVTTMFVMLGEYGRETGWAPTHLALRFTLSGGERRDNEAFAWFRDVTGVPVSDAYASTEVRPAITYDPWVDPVPREGSCGRIVPGVEAQLLGPTGNPVEPGEAGELWLRSTGMFREYFRQPALTADRRTADGWFRTGDIFQRSAEGYWSFTARATDVIRRGEANVSPVEVQNALVRHPRVRDIAVVGLPHPVYGEVVGAVVVGEFQSDEEALRELGEFGRHALAEFKLPSVIRVLPEIPRGATAKFDRRAIVALLAHARGV
jgi:acyl-coenzyme A synthetase/AMP-(fatty) acid ligase